MAGLLDTLRKAAGNEVALNAQRPRDDERIFVRWRIQGAQVPEGVRAVLGKSLPVEDHVLGLNRMCNHQLLPWDHYDRCGNGRQAP